jgi:hypothetical protein
MRKVNYGAPKMFRIALQVGDLEAAGAFYAKLLDDPGIPIRAARVITSTVVRDSGSRGCD